jgi:cytochrome b
MSGNAHQLWDLPVRVFHWSLVVLLPLAWWTGEEGNFDWHSWVGYSLLVLVVTRIVWGVVGSRHARFSDFLKGPGAIRGYLNGEPATTPGHNPLGGWSVVALLSVLLLQAVSGLFNSDDVLYNGPLYYAASTDFRDTMGVIHELAFDALVVLLVLHLLAVAYYQFRRRQPLVQAMLRGQAEGKAGREAPRPWWLAVLIAGLLALLLWWGLSLAPEPPRMW